MTAIPEDLKHLQDFPQYDATFQDHPQFRKRLEQWADKTEQIATSLSGLADSFDKFHETGMEHFKAATSVISHLQKIADICQNDSTNTISSSIQAFVDSMNRIWHYYEAFLGQTQLLNATPIRELANNFAGLKSLHEQVLQYRQEHLTAAEKLCACRHSSKLTDKSVLPTLTEACYSSQKTYQLVLSKFVISLRQAHTIDMMSFMRRMIEFVLSKYAYHNYCTEVLKELEPQVNELFAQTKAWRSHYEREMKLWDKLHIAVKKNVMAEFQHNMGLIPEAMETSPTWSDVAMAPITAGRHMMKKMFLSQTKDIKQPGAVSGEGDWDTVEDPQRRATIAHSQGRGEEEGSPVLLRRETVGADLPTDRVKKERRRRVVRSISNPDLMAAETTDLATDTDTQTGNGSLSGSSSETPPPTGMVVTYSEDTTEAAAEAMEKFLQNPTSQHVSIPFRPLAAVLGGLRGKKKGSKPKRFKRIASADDSAISPPLSPLPAINKDSRSNESSPLLNRKVNHSVFRRAKGSILSHLRSHNPGESTGVRDDTHSREGHPLSGSTDNLCRETDETSQRKKKHHVSLDMEHHVQPRLQISSPLTRDWSGSELRNEELQSLVQPLPTSCAKCGYLWLRMHVDNRYAWNHIWCVVDNESGEVRVQEDGDHITQSLEKLMLCSTKLCTPDFIDRNYCFRIISPSSEHLFQALSSHEQASWIQALQSSTAQALKRSSGRVQSPTVTKEGSTREPEGEMVPDAMTLILNVPGNRTCADCSSSVVEWASVNLGLVLCIECSGVHRGLGVHVSKVRSLNLDTWDRQTVELMLRQGNKKANSYYEATLSTGPHETVRKPATNASKAERSEFIQQKYVALAFVPPLTERLAAADTDCQLST